MSRFLVSALLFQGYLLWSPGFFIQELGLSLTPYIVGFNILIGIYLLLSAFFQSEKTLVLVYIIAYSLSAYIFFNMLDYTYFNPQVQIPQIQASQTKAINLDIFYANIYYQNNHTQELLEQIQEQNTDLVLLVEYSNLQDNAISKELQKKYPYSSRLLGIKGYDGDVIFSRYPLETVRHDNTKLLFSHVRVHYEMRRVDVILAHTSAPTSKNLFELRNKQLEELSTMINSYITKEQPTNIIIAGDLNITPRSAHYQMLENNFLARGMRNLTTDLSSTHYTTSIPYTRCRQNISLICAHIDHIRTNRKGSLEVIPIKGSDHSGFVGNIKVI